MAEQKLKVLIVDDDVAFGQVLKAGLEMHGFTARYEARSTDTIKACLKFQPDLILLDLDMPVKDGGTVAAELQSHPTVRHTPVIFLTSLVRKAEEGKRGTAGTVFLSKQISLAELAARIHAARQPQPPR